MEKTYLLTGELSNLDKLNSRKKHVSATPYMRLKTELERSQVKTKNRRLAGHLKALLAISDGRDIVPFIGSGKEKNNQEALVNWVERQQMDIKSIDFTQQLETLANKLKRDINSAIERFTQY